MQNVKVDRDKYIGGSDIPILMGISPFKTRWELLQEKAGLVQNEFEGNQYTEYGNILEPKIRDYINKDLKDKFVEGKDIVDDIRCHTDGINKTTVLEIKTTSKIHSKLEEYKYYLVQLLFYMKYTNRKKGILAVYRRPENFDETFDDSNLTVFEINIKDFKNLLEEIDIAVDEFRNDLRRIKDNPFLTEADLEPKELTDIAKELEAVEQKLAGLSELTTKRDELKNKLKNKMDEIGKKQLTTSKYKFTRVADGKDSITEEFDEVKFKEENNDLYEKYSQEEVTVVFDLDKFKEEHENEAQKYIIKSVKKGKAGFIRMSIVGDDIDE